MGKHKNNEKQIDWIITLVPFCLIMTIAAFLFIYPTRSNEIIEKVRYFFCDTLGSFYILLGLGMFLLSLFLAFSKYGNIVLGGEGERPKYSFFTWGSMMFTCGLAADILFYSFAEWVMYANNTHISDLGGEDWYGVFPLFHWSLIPWSFYLVLAVVFGFMLHVRKSSRQRFSEACKPVIGEKNATGILGRIIDLFALFALLAGTATTFSVATPLMATIIIELFGVSLSRTTITIAILLLTCAVYTYAVIHGFKGISLLAKVCIYLFFGLLIAVVLIGGQGRFIIEYGIQSMGKMLQNFIELSTYTDPNRANNFPQDWTIYYWAYWMVWCIAAPFFIGNISKGRSVKQVVLGGYVFGVGSTILSFIVLGNYGIGIQNIGDIDFISSYGESGDMYQLILDVIGTLPGSKVILVWVLLCMIAFYATSFDSIAYTAACYGYKKLGEDERPSLFLTFLWCLLLIVLPVALVFSESSMNSIQSISIITAFPIGIIMILMIVGFLKDARNIIED